MNNEITAENARKLSVDVISQKLNSLFTRITRTAIGGERSLLYETQQPSVLSDIKNKLISLGYTVLDSDNKTILISW